MIYSILYSILLLLHQHFIPASFDIVVSAQGSYCTEVALVQILACQPKKVLSGCCFASDCFIRGMALYDLFVCSTLQYSAVRWCGKVQCSAVVQHSAIQNSVAQCSVCQFSAV